MTTFFPSISTFQQYLRIMQWNIRGLLVNYNALTQLIHHYKPQIISLQECCIHYRPRQNEVLPGINNYTIYSDIFFKTAVYVHKQLLSFQLTVTYGYSKNGTYSTITADDLLDIDNFTDVVYCTAVAIKDNNQGDIAGGIHVICSIYNSPNGSTSAAGIFDELEWNVLKQSAQKGWNVNKINWVISGDFNATHPAWGAPPGISHARDQEATELVSAIEAADFLINNDGQPTRFEYRQGYIHYAWIDIIATKGISSDKISSVTIQQDFGSDHHVIITDINTCIKYQGIPGARFKWQIHDKTADWDTFGQVFEEAWTARVDEIKIPEDIYGTVGAQEMADHLCDIFMGAITEASAAVFKYAQGYSQWKPWLTAAAQAKSIEYHTFEREFRRKTQRTAADWNQLKKLRVERNNLCKYYKKRWIEHKFSEVGLQGRDGWAIAAEIRNFNKSGRDVIPKLLHQGQQYITDVAKATAFNQHYHRFDDLQVLPDSTSFANKYYGIQYHQHLPSDLRCLCGQLFIQQQGMQVYSWTNVVICDGCGEEVSSDWVYHCRNDTVSHLHTADYDLCRNCGDRFRMVQQNVNQTDDIKYDLLWKDLDDEINIDGTEDYLKPVADHVLNEQNTQKLHKVFQSLLLRQNYRRRDRCQSYHKEELDRLNAPITTAEIKRAVSGFQNHKSPGPDDVDIRMIKNNMVVMVPILQWLFNHFYLTLGKLPSTLKKRFIVPLAKPGKPKNQVSSYRPISLTSYLSKIYEKIFSCRIVTYLIKLRLLSKCHYAYLKARGTQDAIVLLVDKILRKFQQNQDVHSVFFDFSAAFDCVRINVLLWKLENQFFISGAFLQMIISLFEDRQSAVILGSCLSAWTADIIGVPQGGALSPILFIMYVDGLGILDDIKGLQFTIYADDLHLFTTEGTNLKWKLQFGIRFVQWYNAYHGLNINVGKTKYIHFHRNDASAFRLYFDCTVAERVEFGDDYASDEFTTFFHFITAEKCAVKYLGVWLDPALDFHFHTEKLIKQCNKAYFGIKKNLQYIWRISVDIAWRLLEACVLSIIDYSAVIIPVFQSEDKRSLRTFYNRIIQAAAGVVRGTPLQPQYLQYGTVSFDNRWKMRCVQYFSHLLRIPRSSSLFKYISDFWWKPIKWWILHRFDPYVRVKTKCRFAEYCLDNTLILQLLQYAADSNYSDCCFLQRNSTFLDINRQVSYHLDLTAEWKEITLIPEPYEDGFWPYDSNRFFVFTDGSVDKGKGGYGYFGLNAEDYNEYALQMDPDTFVQQYCVSDSYVVEVSCSKFLSNRTSIDYCEAIAIQNSLLWLVEQTQPVIHRHPHIWLQTVQYFHIISDSQTVLYWINGNFSIAEQAIYHILSSIWISTAVLAERGFSVRFQWVKGHADIQGNEIADLLAKAGLSIGCTTLSSAVNWKYANLRAIKKDIKNKFLQAQKMEFLKYIQESNNAAAYVIGQQRPRAFFRNENKFFNRVQLRYIMAMRTGHDWFNKYQFYYLKSRVTAKCLLCPLCQDQDLYHMFCCCTNTTVIWLRQLYRNEVIEIWSNFYAIIDGIDYDMARQKAECTIDWDNLPLTLFPAESSLCHLLLMAAVTFYWRLKEFVDIAPDIFSV